MSEGHHKRYPHIYAKLVELMTHDYLIAGFCASVNQAEYSNVMGQKLNGQSMRYWFGGPYSFCVGAIGQIANNWLDGHNPSEHDLAYVFEAGYERQGEADTFLQMLNSEMSLADRKRRLRYFSHKFMDGKRREAGALQAADILAWHITDGHRRGAFDEVGKKIVNSVELYSVHYPESGLRETLRSQLNFCDFYWDLKHAKRIEPGR
jgi:hypothetical protein